MLRDFYDTGIVCALLGVQNKNQLLSHPSKGSIFESWVISELCKGFLNGHRVPPLYFWRDHKGLEVDVLIDQGGKLSQVEIKAGKTIPSDAFANLEAWRKLAGAEAGPSWLVYGGSEKQSRSLGNVRPWNELEDLA